MSEPSPLDFLELLWIDEGHSLSVDRGEGFTFVTLFDTPGDLLERIDGSGGDAWWGVNATRGARLRGKAGDVKRAGVLFADLDWQASGHKSDKLPSEEEVRSVLERFPVVPTVIVDTGGGVQPYWLLAEPLPVAEWDRAQALLRAGLEAGGLHVEATDAVRVLRIPGTVNLKYGNTVEISEWNPETTTSLADLEELFGHLVAEVESKPEKSEPVTTDEKLDAAERSGGGPISAYNSSRRLSDELTASGWEANGTHWSRPDHPGGLGESAKILTRDDGSEVLVVYSTAPELSRLRSLGKPCESNREFVMVSPFDLLADREHAGDTERALSAILRAEADREKADELDEEPSSFEPVDLGPWLRGEIEQITPALLTMSDGRALLYLDRYNEIHGDSGAGKSWIEALCIRELVRAELAAVVIDLEDTPAPLIERLRQIGVTDDEIAEYVSFIHPSDPFLGGAGDLSVATIISAIEEIDASHVFIDSLGEALNADGLNENDDRDVGPWIRRVVRRIIDSTDAGVTALDHVTKAGDNPLHPSGSKRKRAAVTGSSWLAVSLTPFSRDAGGKLRLRCGKDRHGHYRQGEDVADLVMGGTVNGRCNFDAEPTTPAEDRAEKREESLAELVTRVAGDHDAPLSQKALIEAVREASGGEGRNEAIRGAIDLAVARGWLLESAGKRNARMFARADLTSPRGGDLAPDRGEVKNDDLAPRRGEVELPSEQGKHSTSPDLAPPRPARSQTTSPTSPGAPKGPGGARSWVHSETDPESPPEKPAPNPWDEPAPRAP